MSDDLLKLRDLIGERAGLFTPDLGGLGFLERCLRSRMEEIGCASFPDYHRLLSLQDLAAETEFLHLITALSRPATSFYRHESTANVLIKGILPRLTGDGERKNLAIWSAGCSTGEEPLTIAMALAEGDWFERFDIAIEASDGNLNSLALARSGRYDAKRIRSLAPESRDKYFVSGDDEWQVKPDLFERIIWSTANLADETEMARRPAVDIIICQKVLIYFSEERTLRVMDQFADLLPPRGFLLTDQGDHADSLMSQNGRFEKHLVDGIAFWGKRDANS